MLEEDHDSEYSIHLRASKMYCDLKVVYQCNVMKKYCEFVSKCLNL